MKVYDVVECLSSSFSVLQTNLDRTSHNVETIVNEFGTQVDSFQEYVGLLNTKKEEFNARYLGIDTPDVLMVY